MPRSWTTSGLDLHLALPGGHGRRAAIEAALREAIRGGRLPAGTRLPSSRVLAEDLGVARGTVVEAYAQLAAEGWLAGRRGSGTVVAASIATAPRGGGAAPSPAQAAHARLDLRAGYPDAGAFPRDAWLRALRRALRAAPDAALQGDDPRGAAPLREALAAYLARARGVVTAPERIVVCSGFTQGLGLLCAVVGERGARSVALEDPCLPDARAIVTRAGLPVRAIAVDEDGARVDGLPPGAAAVVTPAHQFPLGPTLTAARRGTLVAWARSDDGLIVEDDYDGEFRYDRKPVGALQALDPERVVYAGSASKPLAPGLRVAWLALPAGLVEPVAEAKRLADRQTGILEQLALAELLGGGGYDRQVRRMRARYRRRRDALAAMLARRAPRLRPLGVAAGLHAVLPLPPGAPGERDLVAAARERDVAIDRLGPFWHDAEDRPEGLLAGYAAPPDHTFAAALEALGDLLGAAVQGSASQAVPFPSPSRRSGSDAGPPRASK